MPQPRPASLVEVIGSSRSNPAAFIANATNTIAVSELVSKANLETGSFMRGKCVLLATLSQLSTALALIALDGLARRVVICTPDLSQEHLTFATVDAGADVIVTDGGRATLDIGDGLPVVPCSEHLRHSLNRNGETGETEWVMFTSGTTGRPKLVLHTLSSLMGAIGHGVGFTGTPPIWSTFYDIRRYGGMQVLLRALASGGSIVLSDSSEPPSLFLQRVGAAGVTHISGTPSHWRRALMSGALMEMAPEYIRLSGEAADQTILDTLMHHYPNAQVAHAFASTEAGVAFDVRDGKAGFPATLMSCEGPVELKVEESSLRIRSSRNASRYLGANVPVLAAPDGFVDTGDIVEQHGDRFLFVGRRNDIINVGGIKVHPEAVESVINRHPAVSMSRVSSRKSPITGSVIVADVVLRESENKITGVESTLMAFCRQSLPRHEVPVSLRIVSSLAIAASGKMARHYA